MPRNMGPRHLPQGDMNQPGTGRNHYDHEAHKSETQSMENLVDSGTVNVKVDIAPLKWNF